MSNDAIAEVAKTGSSGVIRFRIAEFGGAPTWDVRIWYPARDGTLVPSKSGVSGPMDRLADAAEAFQQLYEAALARGLVPASN